MKLSFPHPLILLLGFIFFASILTHLLPAGEFDRKIDEKTGRSVVIPGTFHKVDAEPIGLFDTFVKVPAGIIDRADIIILILLIGGAFFIVDQTGAFQEGLNFLIHRFKNAKYLVIILVGILFAAGGATENMQEEIIAMIPIMLLLTRSLGYKKFTAVALSVGSAIIGASFSPINPFQVMLAQILSEVPVLSGALFRTIFFVIALAFWLFWIIKYGKDHSIKETPPSLKAPTLSIQNVIILLLLVITFTCMTYGILVWDWGYNKMSASFFIFGMTAGIIGKMGINGTARNYALGFKDMIFSGIVVGLAGSVTLVMQEGKIIDTIAYGLFMPLQHLPESLTAIGMMFSHVIIHMPMPSVSGQAALTMPLLTPLADLLGMSRQIMILAYQYGAGMADMIVPTNGALLAILVAANISYKEWIKIIIKPTLIIFGIAISALLIAFIVQL